MVGRIITTDACVHEGVAWLSAQDPRWAAAAVRLGPLPLRLRASGFQALLDAITGQQVSVASADAVWRRLDAAGLTQPQTIVAASDEDLRACGMSRQKTRYARALAEASLDYGTIDAMPNDELIAELVRIPGIGRWTAEIYAMFSLGRADVFAPGDLALQEAARLLFGLEARPTERALRVMAEAWSPWRSVAARLLWGYYGLAKSREGIR